MGSAAHAQELAADEGARSRPTSTTTSSATSAAATASSTPRRVRVYSVGPEDSMSRVAGPLHRARGRALRAVAPHPPDGARGPLRARQRSLVVHAAGLPGGACSARPTRTSPSSTPPTTRSTGWTSRYLAQNARVNAAAAASLALAPAAPKVVDERARICSARGPSGYDAQLRWNASPGAVAYRVYWRDTWTNDWQHRQTVGNVTRVRAANVSIDDFVFGVAAVGADGHESLVSAYVSPVRACADVKIVKSSWTTSLSERGLPGPGPSSGRGISAARRGRPWWRPRSA